MTKRELRKHLISKRLTIAEAMRQTGASRLALTRFRNTGVINPATLARILVYVELPDVKKGKGEE